MKRARTHVIASATKRRGGAHERTRVTTLLDRILACALGLSVSLAMGCETRLGSVEDARTASDAAQRDAARSDAGPAVPDAALDARALSDAGTPDVCAEPLPATPGRILFVGNSFTFTARMPSVFAGLVAASGFPAPEVATRAIGGETLEGHRADTSLDGAPERVGEGWDVVVLQELSTRPTDAIGPAEQFKEDATWFHDLAITASPGAQVILYETFARRAGHSVYPDVFTDPADMQAQLRFHYEDCAESYIPTHSTVVMERPVQVARVGDAWESLLADGEPPRLHGDDDYHPNAHGAYLTALVFFGTIYGRRTEGLPAIGIEASGAAELQAAADAITGSARLAPALECPRGIPVGDTLAIDLGPLDAGASGWVTASEVAATVGPLTSLAGVGTDATLTTRGFTGVQTGGSAANDLGLPGAVSQDSLWVGSFDGHAAALGLSAEIELRGLVPGSYTLELFASRDGDDGGNGRLTRYGVGARALDLEVTDNRSRAVTFDGVSPDARGVITIGVGVSPAGSARFAYAGSLRVTRTR